MLSVNLGQLILLLGSLISVSVGGFRLNSRKFAIKNELQMVKTNVVLFV